MSRQLGKLLFGSLTGATFGLGAWQTSRFFEEKPAPKLIEIPLKAVDLSKVVWVGPRNGGPANRRGYFAYAPAVSHGALVCLGWTAEKPFDTASLADQQDLANRIIHAETRPGESGNRFSPANPPGGPFMWMDEENMKRAAGLDPAKSLLADTYEPAIPGVFAPKTKPEAYLTKWTHAGYAATWYTLGFSGLVMMRKMFR